MKMNYERKSVWKCHYVQISPGYFNFLHMSISTNLPKLVVCTLIYSAQLTSPHLLKLSFLDELFLLFFIFYSPSLNQGFQITVTVFPVWRERALSQQILKEKQILPKVNHGVFTPHQNWAPTEAESSRDHTFSLQPLPGQSSPQEHGIEASFHIFNFKD